MTNWRHGAPGSREAVDAGCTCAVLDNGHGKGRYSDGDKYGWLITETCQLHANPAPEGEAKTSGPSETSPTSSTA